jgi:hypothetical protein
VKDEILAYLQERAGIEFDGDMVRAFVQMVGEWEPAAAFEGNEEEQTGAADDVSDVVDEDGEPEAESVSDNS